MSRSDYRTFAKDHDYFVGETGFLVHNDGPCGCRPPLLPIEFDPSDLFPGSVAPENEAGIFEYLATGTYGGDRAALLNEIGIPDPGSGWQSHHVGYDPDTNIMRGQLVNREAHQYPHRGGADEYRKANGCGYVWPE